MGVGHHQKKRGRFHLRLIRYALVTAALVYVGREVVRRGPELTALPMHAGWLLLSVAAFALALFGQVQAWRWNLARLGADVSYPALFRLYYAANLARYIPGKVWSLLGMVSGGIRLGIDSTRMTTTVVVGLASSLVSGLWVGVIALWVRGTLEFTHLWLAPLPLAALLLIWPPLFHRWAGWVLRRWRPGLPAPRVSRVLVVRSLLHYALVWCAYGAAVAALARGVGEDALLLYFASFPLAYLSGYATLLAPGGWGVREGALIALAGGGVAALAVAIWQRLILTLFEFVLFAFSIWSWRHD